MMLQSLALLLPALIPSWRFFDTIAPSPRIEFVVLNSLDEDNAQNWQEFRPRPAKLSFSTILKRLFWNPRWNESLFLVSCAERLIKYSEESTGQHACEEIRKRICAYATGKFMQFRLVFILRGDGGQLEKHIAFVSPVYSYSEGEEI